MRRSSVLGFGFVVIALTSFTVQAQQIELVPISADGSHSIVGNEIILDGAGQRVWIDIFVSGWGPLELRTFQAKIDSTGYSSGTAGVIGPAVQACTTDADCVAALGTRSVCNVPPGAGTTCEAGFIDSDRADWVFTGKTAIVAVNLFDLNYTFGGSILFPPFMTDPGVAGYGGSLVLDIPTGAIGTFTVALNPADSFLKDQNSDNMSPMTLGSVLVTVKCATNADCDDGNACTNDSCDAGGSCVNVDNYNEATECCTPLDGTITPIDDGSECTTDTCDPLTGAVTHAALPTGTTCGNPANSECDGADTCDGAGVCLDNIASTGSPCGSLVTTDCSDPDSCDGAGTCEPNHLVAGAFCGDPGDTDCDNPDTCDDAGQCLANNEPDGTTCDDGLFCNVDESCSGGSCGNGIPVDCDDSIACTTDSCSEVASACQNDLDAGSCLIGGSCHADGTVNPDNDCEVCDTLSSPSDWSPRDSGSGCDDGDPCTGTGRTGIGFDVCDGAGSCAGTLDPECNDDCPFAVEVFEGVNTGNNDNRGADDTEASCQADSNNDVWFVFTATCTGTTFVSTTGSQFLPSNDSVLSVFDACPGDSGVELVCDDDSGADLAAALTFEAIGGSSYQIRVAGFENNTGDIVLNILAVDDCVIEGICHSAGSDNPENQCEACIPELSTSGWSPQPEGMACGSAVDSECDSPDACDGAGICESNPKPDGTQCSDEGNECTVDICQAGTCAHPPSAPDTACGDGSDSECDHPDTCDGSGACLPNYENTGTLCGDGSDDQCDFPDECDGSGLCDANLASNGTSCDDADVCTGGDVCETGACVGTAIPEAPMVAGVGSRSISITAMPVGSLAPVALHLTSPDWPCLDVYIAPGGTITNTAVFQLPADWGTVVVSDPTVIVPSSLYEVVAECGTFMSLAGSDMTALWGDVAGMWTGSAWTPPDGVVDFDDITATVDAFRRLPGAPATILVDLSPCNPNRVIDFDDIAREVDAFRGLAYPCAAPCP